MSPDKLVILLTILIVVKLHHGARYGADEDIKHYNLTFEPKTQIVAQFSNTKLVCEAIKITDPFRVIYLEVRKKYQGAYMLHDICEIDAYEYECSEYNFECSSCVTNKTYAKLDITIRNITWQDRGEYRCNVMGNVLKYATIDVAVPPSKVDCHRKLKEITSNDMEVIECDIGCTHPKPNFEIKEEHEIIYEESKECKGKFEGMKKYKKTFAVKISDNFRLVISSIGFNRRFEFFTNKSKNVFQGTEGIYRPIITLCDMDHIIPLSVISAVALCIIEGFLFYQILGSIIKNCNLCEKEIHATSNRRKKFVKDEPSVIPKLDVLLEKDDESKSIYYSCQSIDIVMNTPITLDLHVESKEDDMFEKFSGTDDSGISSKDSESSYRREGRLNISSPSVASESFVTNSSSDSSSNNSDE